MINKLNVIMGKRWHPYFNNKDKDAIGNKIASNFAK
jgi:hypothetical protein